MRSKEKSMRERLWQSERLRGVLPLNKPPGISSARALQTVKKSLRLSKAGHTGTLDPLAQGVLVILAGGATKIVPFIGDWEKEYIATAKLGIITTTDDVEGEIISSKSGKFGQDEISKLLKDFEGETEQVPPVYSAKKYKGRPHYYYARAGMEPKREAAKIIINAVELIDYEYPEVTFRISCRSGTYVRSVCRDLGEKLGIGACLSKLTRTANGPFRLDDSCGLEEVVGDPQGALKKMRNISPDFFSLKKMSLNRNPVFLVSSGGAVLRENIDLPSNELDIKAGELVCMVYKGCEVSGIFESLFDSHGLIEAKAQETIFRAKRMFN